jgi:hypothetical protein
VSTPEGGNAEELSDADHIEILEQSLRELELEERGLRLQQQIEEKKKTVLELRSAAAAAVSPTHPSSAPAPPSTQRSASKRLVDYVPSHSSGDDVEVTEGMFYRKDKAIKLDSINPAQWVVASNRIMLALIGEQDWSMQEVKDYICHQIKIGELATRYTWTSVIQYDQEYRDKRADELFRFGADSGHLSRVLLRDRDSASKRPPQANSKARPKESQSVCLLFNTDKGCHFASRCKFDHVCSVCLKGHSRLEHPGEACKGSSA